jgi:hypothetical protein
MERLFSRLDLRGTLEAHRQKGESEIATLTDHNDLLPQSEAEVLKRFYEKYVVAPLDLVSDGVEVEREDTKIDVSGDPMRVIRDPSQPFYMPGQLVRYYTKYLGDRGLWDAQPSQFTWSPPAAEEVTDDEIIFEFRVLGTDIAPTKREFDEQMGRIREYMTWIRNDVSQHNDSLMPAFRTALARRREELAKSQQGLESLGLPIRKRTERPPLPTPAPALTTPARASKKATAKQQAFAYDVALSFAGEDRKYVEEVAEGLKTAKVRVFYDKFEKATLWGKNLADHLGKVYGELSRFVVLFVSQHYPQKSWPTHERQSAQARAIRKGEVVLLPVRFDDTEIDGLPSTVGYVDLRTTPAAELVTLIREKLNED